MYGAHGEDRRVPLEETVRAIAELEQEVAERPEYLALATQIHALAHRP